MPVGIITAAAVVGGAAVVSAGVGAAASKNAADQASHAAETNNTLQKQVYAANTANEQPFIDAGKGATSELNGLLNINGNTPDGSAAATDSLNKYLASSGFNFVSGQGNRAITANASVNGLLDSGGTLKALDTYNEGLASTYLGNYEGELSGVAQTGASAAGNLSGVGTNYAGAVSANNNNAAATSANAGLSTASNINALLSSAIGAFGLTKGLSSYGGGGAGGSSGGASPMAN